MSTTPAETRSSAARTRRLRARKRQGTCCVMVDVSLGELAALELPILAGPSRKSFVGFTLKLPPEERLEGTAAAVALLIERGADIVRVHDVKAMRRVAAFTDAVARR